MTKRDVLIFLSDVSNQELADYVTEALELDLINRAVTPEDAQRFKEWLAGKLADEAPAHDEDEVVEDNIHIFQPDE